VNHTAYVISLDYSLTFFTKGHLQDLVEVVRLLIVLKPSDSTFQHYEADLEYIERPLGLQIGRLAY
jgi:hypothetical protein